MISDFDDLPKLYRELADWWPVLSSPEDYAEEAEFYRQAIVTACGSNPQTVLELGSGGGNNASHMKRHFKITLVDLSPDMLRVSRELNPECEHIEGDMREVRLGRQFDAIFIHDAIVYMQSKEELRCAIETAYEHCMPGGVALFAPDHTLETFQPSTSHGGHDQGNRSMRYLDWVWDPDPSDSTYLSLMIYALREGNEPVQCVVDQHICGLFSQSDWLRVISEVGFISELIPFEHSESEAEGCDVFLGLKPLE